MITRKALRASAKARRNPGGSLVALLKEGEAAARQGLPAAANPHTGEDAEIWLEVYNEINPHTESPT